jgi:seryl-tRNA(Sec) selenium transferase
METYSNTDEKDREQPKTKKDKRIKKNLLKQAKKLSPRLKKVSSSYILFFTEKYEEVRSQFLSDELKQENKPMQIKHIGKKMGELWRNMSSDEKEV